MDFELRLSPSQCRTLTGFIPVLRVRDPGCARSPRRPCDPGLECTTPLALKTKRPRHLRDSAQIKVARPFGASTVVARDIAACAIVPSAIGVGAPLAPGLEPNTHQQVGVASAFNALEARARSPPTPKALHNLAQGRPPRRAHPGLQSTISPTNPVRVPQMRHPTQPLTKSRLGSYDCRVAPQLATPRKKLRNACPPC